MKGKTAWQLAEDYLKNLNVGIEDLTWREEDNIGEAFVTGFSANKKLTNKTLLDTLNKLRSDLQDETKPKLGKYLREDKIEVLKGQIQVIEQLQNKLK